MSAAVRARRALVADVAVAALIAIIVLALGPGLGVVAWFGIPLLLVGAICTVVERGLARRHARARRDS